MPGPCQYEAGVARAVDALHPHRAAVWLQIGHRVGLRGMSRIRVCPALRLHSQQRVLEARPLGAAVFPSAEALRGAPEWSVPGCNGETGITWRIGLRAQRLAPVARRLSGRGRRDKDVAAHAPMSALRRRWDTLRGLAWWLRIEGQARIGRVPRGHA